MIITAQSKNSLNAKKKQLLQESAKKREQLLIEQAAVVRSKPKNASWSSTGGIDIAIEDLELKLQ